MLARAGVRASIRCMASLEFLSELICFNVKCVQTGILQNAFTRTSRTPLLLYISCLLGTLSAVLFYSYFSCIRYGVHIHEFAMVLVQHFVSMHLSPSDRARRHKSERGAQPLAVLLCHLYTPYRYMDIIGSLPSCR